MQKYRVLQKPVSTIRQDGQPYPSFAEVIELTDVQAGPLLRRNIVKGPLKAGQWEEDELEDNHKPPQLPRIEDVMAQQGLGQQLSAVDQPKASKAEGKPAQGGSLSLNQATAEELKALPNIGRATAAKIIAGRGEDGYASMADAFAASQLTQSEWDEAIAGGVTL